jgi:hypothetical protein
MTAVTLYDALAQANGAAAVPAAGPLKWLAEQLIAASLADLQRLREFEEHCLTRDWRDADLHRRLTRSIYELDRQWVAEAEQILDRVRPPTGADATSVAATTPRADELEDACWRIRARLQLTPDQSSAPPIRPGAARPFPPRNSAMSFALAFHYPRPLRLSSSAPPALPGMNLSDEEEQAQSSQRTQRAQRRDRVVD